jgi:hypothetical protein
MNGRRVELRGLDLYNFCGKSSNVNSSSSSGSEHSGELGSYKQKGQKKKKEEKTEKFKQQTKRNTILTRKTCL